MIITANSRECNEKLKFATEFYLKYLLHVCSEYKLFMKII